MKQRHSALVLMMVALAACMPGVNSQVGVDSPEGYVAGFGLGVLHGFLVPVSFVLSLFGDSVNIYEVHNTGNWYDIGFVLGAALLITLLGGVSWRFSKKRSDG